MVYCPYQWYYEKIYGRAELRRMRKEYLEELGLEDSTTANFVRGEAFHRKLYRQYRLRRLLGKIVAGAGDLKGAVPSTRGPGWTDLWCTSCRANGTAG